MKKLLIGIVMGTVMVAAGRAPAQAEISPLKIERVQVMPRGQLALDAGIAYEMDREYQDREYDNLQLAPLGLRYGIGDSAEIGGSIAYSDNSDNDHGAPDESGLEGVTLFGKLAINENFALQAGFTFLGEDDVFPYANDGLDVFVNVPMQRKIGPGLLYGQFGYRVQGGDYDNTSYFNYGMGYGYPVNKQFNLNVELVGEEAQKGTNNTLDLVLGGNFILNRNVRIAPFLSVGLYEDSPDVAIGTYLQVMF
jgi:hypothetical protein